MQRISHRLQMTELFYPASMLALLLFFTYGIFIRTPYIGFYFNPTDGTILQIFHPSDSLWGDLMTSSFSLGAPLPASDSPESLHLGDKLIKAGNISFQEYHENSRQGLLNDVKDGDTVPIIVNRNDAEITISWKIPGFNQAEFYARFFNIWWLAYIFWFFGFTAQMFVRPKDTRWRLLAASNYLTGLWVILGALSARHLWESSILLRATTWSLLPIYLHFHWLFPKPLTPAPKSIVVILYAASLPFILGEIFQILPRSLYALGFLLMLIGIIVLQVTHFIRHRAERRDVRLAALATLLAILPTITLSVFGAAGVIPLIAMLGLLTLPFMPLTYLFIIYRNQLGGLEMRANKFISLYAFLIILGTILIILITPTVSLQIPGNTSVLLALGVTLFTAFISIQLFPAFQAFVEKRLLGIKLPYQNLQETYSSRITASTSLSSLLQLLNDEVFPSLLVRQFAVMEVINGNLKALLTKDVNPEQLPHKNDMNGLASQAGNYLPNTAPDNGWMCLILPLKIGDSFIGFWLLGRRDPDDSYPHAEILILQSIANQTAIALSNLLHIEQVEKMYQSNIEWHEQERTHLARELHDSVLNELAFLHKNLDEASLSPKVQTSYEEVTNRLRKIASDLRPNMLMYGVVPAINELTDNLMERHNDKVNIKVDIQAGEERLLQSTEQHIFRITQQACENAIRHGSAKNISIFGTLNTQAINLTIEDDGTGFDAQLDMDNLLANNHFGLTNMIERAHLIGAEINIQSNLGAGTKIHITRKV